MMNTLPPPKRTCLLKKYSTSALQCSVQDPSLLPVLRDSVQWTFATPRIKTRRDRIFISPLSSTITWPVTLSPGWQTDLLLSRQISKHFSLPIVSTSLPLFPVATTDHGRRKKVEKSAHNRPTHGMDHDVYPPQKDRPTDRLDFQKKAREALGMQELPSQIVLFLDNKRRWWWSQNPLKRRHHTLLIPCQPGTTKMFMAHSELNQHVHKTTFCYSAIRLFINFCSF